MDGGAPDVVVEVEGRAAKRGIIPRLPAGERLLSDLEAWLRAESADYVRAIHCGRLPAGEATLAASLHPAAPPLRVTADDAGRVTARAVTSAVGAGYHTFVARLLEQAGEALSIEWSEATEATDGSDGRAGGTGRFVAPLRAAAEEAQLISLGSALVRARAARRQGASGIHLGTPPGVVFESAAALVTPLGPRDDAWLERALADTRVAIDVCPWWADATDARYLLNRALCLMWTEVRWRAPATDDERATDDDVLALLHRAFPLDPSLPYPWREWKELLDLRGVSGPMARQVAERVAAQAPNAAGGPDASPDAARPEVDVPIGYRRGEATVLHEGWALRIPGTFVERRTDDEWSGGEGGRRITLAATSTGDEQGPMRPQAFLDQVAQDLGDELLRHEDGAVLGRARLREDTSSGMSVGVLEGFSAVVGSGAVIRLEFDDPTDWSWAVEQWKGLRPA
jgi:hypothetical protein